MTKFFTALSLQTQIVGGFSPRSQFEMNSFASPEALPLYSPLPTTTSIRLLEVHPSDVNVGAILSCTLRVEDLENEGLDYVALSYTWGDPFFRYWWDENKSRTWEKGVPILCNGVRVDITSNLEVALRTISQLPSGPPAVRHRKQLLWIDALSINQIDLLERSSQVNMMARIYNRASLVISWLGPSDKDSEVAIRLIKRLMAVKYLQELSDSRPITVQYPITLRRSQKLDVNRSHQEMDNFMEATPGAADMEDIDAIPSIQYESLTRFLARRYFFRCWVLQEVMLARKLCMLCGTDQVDLADLHKIAVLVSWIRKKRLDDPVGQALSLPMKGTRGFEHERAVTELWQYRQRLATETHHGPHNAPFAFEHLFALARISSCQDPKDKIYSLLGLIPRDTFKITPDYSKTPEEVYNYSTRYWINETRSLNCLSWVTDKINRSFPNNATWIGEFHNSTNQQELAFTNIAYDATLHSTIKSSVQLTPLDPRILPVRGVCVDHVIELAQPWTWHGSGVGYDSLWTSMTLKLPQTYPFTGQTRGEALINTVVGNEVNNAPFRAQRDMAEFMNVVRRDTCFAFVRELHRMLWYSNLDDSELRYDETAYTMLHDVDTLAKTDSSGFIASWAEIKEIESTTCICNANLSHIDGTQRVRRPSANPACFYTKNVHRRVSKNFPYNTLVALDQDSSPTNLPDAQGWEHYFSMALNHKLHSRRLARTERGYLGLVSDSSQLGDSVWLLQGTRVPFILRQTLYTSERLAQGGRKKVQSTWEVIGDAYVHGVMQGEVWKDVLEEQLEEISLV